MGSLQFSSGKAEIIDVHRCVGDVSFFFFLILVILSVFALELIDDECFFLRLARPT